ncbi:DNA-3-methyladenine glycosylase [Adhaeribacter pallidiroseus]|uniref:Putative 3-methyladenine DNA glycosylase n=1 Tax=Adhaeribacter pallidiroseus TaxID=2072847 RepID=A0A369QNW4_9BACT|nr:DNA-3-methyladenine glycosylase [Adhaeribacter pallidiroseus]RDC64966.1 DNA-3-methyladenine glycosylase II [Adhaeribacter pallidiroseus]
MTKLAKPFYTRPDVVQISRELIGKYIFTRMDGVLTGGRIVETEAYCGENDLACHSHSGRRTTRTEIMFQEGGMAYVYLIYGIYCLFNIITNVAEKADAVLIRAIEPTEGIPEMLLRRNHTQVTPKLTAGPGLVTLALGISKKHYGTDLTGDLIWLEDLGELIPENQIISSPRVGVDYAGEDALLPWRFRLKNSRWTSKAK